MVFHSKPEISPVPDKLSPENQLHEVTLQTFEKDKQGEIEEDYDDEEEEDDDDDEWDWYESERGDFTKRYTAMRAGNNPQVFVKEGQCWPQTWARIHKTFCLTTKWSI